MATSNKLNKQSSTINKSGKTVVKSKTTIKPKKISILKRSVDIVTMLVKQTRENFGKGKANVKSAFDKKARNIIKSLSNGATPIYNFTSKSDTMPFRMRKVMEKITTKFVFITPEIALDILAFNNIKNRSVSKSNVEVIGSALNKDDWNSFNGNMITFDTNGNVIDGQHRLYAIVAMETGIWVELRFNLPVESKFTIDDGKQRSPKEVLEFLGYTSSVSSSIGPAIRTILNSIKHHTNTDVSDKQGNVSVIEYSKLNGEDYWNEVYDKCSVYFKGGKTNKGKGFWCGKVPKSTIIILYHLLDRFDTNKNFDLDDFFEKMFVDGSGISVDSPYMQFRSEMDYYYKKIAARGKKNIDSNIKTIFMQLFVKAYDNIARGKKVKVTYINNQGPRKFNFFTESIELVK